MYLFWLTVFLALVVFIGGLPATIRRVKAQREALRPIQPITRSDHLPCMLNTIGAALTEFFMLGLMALAVFVASNAAFGTVWQAPDLTTGFRHLSIGTIALLVTIAATISLILSGGAFARAALVFGGVFSVVAWMVLSTTGDQGPAIVLFALLAVGAPTLLIAILRRLL